MAPYDYGQLPLVNPAYQQGYNPLPSHPHPSIDPSNQYSVMNSYPPPPQQALPSSQYGSMMMYPPKTEANFLTHVPSPLPMQTMNYPMAPNGGRSPLRRSFVFLTALLGSDANYMYSAPSMPISSGNVPYSQQQQQQQQQPAATPMVNDQKPEPQLITFD